MLPTSYREKRRSFSPSPEESTHSNGLSVTTIGVGNKQLDVAVYEGVEAERTGRDRILRPVPTGGRRKHQIAATVASLDPKDMPSVEAMAALVELKAACITLSEQLCETTEDAIDFDRSVAHILRAQTRLGLERDKLFPTYEIGPLMFQKSVERR